MFRRVMRLHLSQNHEQQRNVDALRQLRFQHRFLLIQAHIRQVNDKLGEQD